jgi:hypothetical protein
VGESEGRRRGGHIINLLAWAAHVQARQPGQTKKPRVKLKVYVDDSDDPDQ